MSENNVIYRDFCEDDAHDVSEMLGGIWSSHLKGEASLFAGEIDFAHFAIKSTHMLVAELNGRVVGIACVGVKSPSDEVVSFWQEFSDNAYSKLRDIDADAAQEMSDYALFEKCVHTKMLSECQECTDYELTLFAVSSEARGHGVGSTLLKQAMQILKDAGAKSYFLFTDTMCTWQYYENRGMKRIASYHSTEDEIKKYETEEFYIYSTEI